MSDTQRVDIGHGLLAALRIADDDYPHAPAGSVLGVVLWHVCVKREGAITEDFIPVNYMGPHHDWRLVSRDPITIEPSVHYTCCGLHGFLRDGRWVPA